jgi:hypothetical protein
LPLEHRLAEDRDAPDASAGVARAQMPDNASGGADPGAGIPISANDTGIQTADAGAAGNTVQGNRIGTESADAAALATLQTACSWPTRR